MAAGASRARKSGGIPFSATAFWRGLAVGGVVLLALFLWLSLEASETREWLASRAPGKTVEIESLKASSDAIHVINRGLEETAEAEKTPGPEASTPETNQPIETHPLDTPAAEAPAPAPATVITLPPAPIEGLYQVTPAGKAPLARQSDGMTPFEAYRRPFTPTPGKSAISIVFYGMGVSNNTTRAVIDDFAPETSLAFVADVSTSPALAAAAREKGHETWIVLPMEGDRYPQVDPGANTLLRRASLTQNRDRLMTVLTRFAGYAGVVTPPDHAFREDDVKDNPAIVKEVFGRGLAIVDSRTDLPFFAARIARENGYPYGRAMWWLGPDLDPEQIKETLTNAEDIALLRGHSVIFVEPTPLNLKYIKGWMGTWGEKSLEAAPLSATVTQAEPQPTEAEHTEEKETLSPVVPESPAPSSPGAAAHDAPPETNKAAH